MTTYYDGCILEVKCTDKKVVAIIFSSYSDFIVNLDSNMNPYLSRGH